jgi:transposase
MSYGWRNPQGLSDWIGSHTRTFAFIGGVTAMVVSDNLRSGITKACFYEPAVNRTYAEMAARHLGASRRALFEDLERSALKPLPAEPYVFAEWKECWR